MMWSNDSILDTMGVGNDGCDCPLVVGRTNPEAKKLWVAFYDEHNKQRSELTGDLAAVWSKLEGYAARFALVINMVRCEAGGKTIVSPEHVDEQSMRAGIAISQWFGRDSKPVYQMLDESETEQDRRRLIELVKRKGNAITVRDLMRSSQKYMTSDDAETALDDLVAPKSGTWKDVTASPSGGRPTRIFVLKDVDIDTTPAKNCAKMRVLSDAASNQATSGAKYEGNDTLI